jgi:Protein of unknown function (DUF1559)
VEAAVSTRAVVFAFACALVALPACKKKQPEPDPVPSAPPQPEPPQPKGPRPKPPAPKGPTNPEPTAPKGPLNYAMGTQFELETRNNLRKVALALFAAETVHGRVPLALADKTGKPGLSWRVAVLPFVEQEALYKQFKLDEPWDSPHNIKLADAMPTVFAAPNTTGRNTYYRVFTGPNTPFPSAGARRSPVRTSRSSPTAARSRFLWWKRSNRSCGPSPTNSRSTRSARRNWAASTPTGSTRSSATARSGSCATP